MFVGILKFDAGATFANLVTYFGSSSWLWYGVTALSLIRLRWSDPDRPRPFKTPLVSAAAVALIAVYLVVSEGATNPVSTLASMGAKNCYPVFDVIPHSFFEPMSYRIGVK